MVDTMTATKVVGSLCGALLFFLLAQWVAETLYHVHGSGEGVVEMVSAELVVTETAVEEEIDIAALLATGDPSKGTKVFVKCKACHKLEEGANTVGPSLHDIMGRTAGTVSGFAYSTQMVEFGQVWTPELMYEFLANPRKFLPGTKMSFAGLKKPADLANVITYIQSVGN